MARFSVTRHCPLAVQFWLYGLDARNGDLTRLGYRKSPTPHGSSAYATDFLRLHSAGLSVPTAQGKVQFQRRTGKFTVNGQTLPPGQGYALVWAAVMCHEAGLSRLHGEGWRERQLQAHRLPPPIRRNGGLWREYVRPLREGGAGGPADVGRCQDNKKSASSAVLDIR